MQTVQRTQPIRVFLDATVLADVEASARALAERGFTTTCDAGLSVGADLVVAAAKPNASHATWIAVVDGNDATGFGLALEQGAAAVLACDAHTDDLVRSVQLAARDLQRSRVQQRVTDLLARVERATGVGSFEFEQSGGALWLSAEARRLVGVANEDVGDSFESLLSRIEPVERRRFAEWLAHVGSGQVGREFECRLADGAVTATWIRFSVPGGSLASTESAVRGVVEEWREPTAAAPDAETPDGFGFQLDARQFLCALASTIEASEARNRAVGVFVIDSEDLRSAMTSLTRGTQNHLFHGLAVRARSALHEVQGLRADGSTHDALVLGRTSSGGFVVVVPNLDRSADVVQLGTRLGAWIAKPVSVGGRELTFSARIGATVSALDCRDPEELVRRAETAAYCARREGREFVKPWANSMDAEAFERLSMDAALRRALTRDELVLHYQPRVDVRTGRIVGMEALVRWRHPDLGFVSPVRFIPVAEETGLIVPIGAHVMLTACKQARAWVDAGLQPIRMSVNLSPLQLHDAGLLATIADCLRASGLPSSALELELTEGALMQNPVADVELLRQIKSLGVHLSIDDFGTGYSSLAYLRRFPVDALKIDRSFLRDATSRPDDASIFSAIVLMGRSLKMTVVSEGVETPAQLALLRVMRADEAQGFLLSPPVPADQAARLLAKGTLGAPTA